MLNQSSFILLGELSEHSRKPVILNIAISLDSHIQNVYWLIPGDLVLIIERSMTGLWECGALGWGVTEAAHYFIKDPDKIFKGPERDHSAHPLTRWREGVVQQNITDTSYMSHAIVVEVGGKGHSV